MITRYTHTVQVPHLSLLSLQEGHDHQVHPYRTGAPPALTQPAGGTWSPGTPIPYRCPTCPYSACRRDMITRCAQSEAHNKDNVAEQSQPINLCLSESFCNRSIKENFFLIEVFLFKIWTRGSLHFYGGGTESFPDLFFSWKKLSILYTVHICIIWPSISMGFRAINSQ